MAKKISREKIEQIAKLHFLGISNRLTANFARVARTTAVKYIRLYSKHELTPEELHDLSDSDFEKLFGKYAISKSLVNITIQHQSEKTYHTFSVKDPYNLSSKEVSAIFDEMNVKGILVKGKFYEK